MYSREGVQAFLNTHRQDFGRPIIDSRPIWSTTAVSDEDVLHAGTRHSCPVIHKVVGSGDRSDLAIWRSYQSKNNLFVHVSDQLGTCSRTDLQHDWNSREIRQRRQKTHPTMAAVRQYPDGYHRQQLMPNARMPQFYISDHFKTLDHISHNAFPGLAIPASDTAKFAIDIDDYRICITRATSLVDLTAEVALRTADILKSRGVDCHTIAKLLSESFAKTGSIQEYGQQKPASRIVGVIIKKIVASGSHPGLAGEFRRLSRPKVEKYYHGQRNPRL